MMTCMLRWPYGSVSVFQGSKQARADIQGLAKAKLSPYRGFHKSLHVHPQAQEH